MGKIQKVKIFFLAIGVFVFGIGIYIEFLTNLRLDGGILTTAGLIVALSGFRYQQREKTVRRQKGKMTLSRLVGLIGLIIIFPSMGFILIASALNIKSGWVLTAYALCFLIGVPLVLVANQLRKSEEKQTVHHH